MQRKRWTLLAVSAATFMLLLDITVVNVALPSIRQDLGASFTDLQWVVDAYPLTLAALVLRAAAGAGAVWRGGGAGGAGRGRHPAVPAGRRLGVRRRPGPWALPGGLAWGVRGSRSAAAGRRLGGRHCGDPGQGGAGAPPAPTLAAWTAQSPEHPAADRAPHAVLGSGQAADRRRGGGRPAGRARPDGADLTQPRASANDEDADAKGTRG
jgi:MFS family permease